MRKSLAVLIVIFACTVFSACGEKFAVIEQDKEYFIEDIESYVFRFPDGTDKDLVDYDISYCKFTDNYSRFTLYFSNDTPTTFTADSWTEVSFAVTGVSDSKTNLRADIASLVNGRVARFTVTVDASRIYITTPTTITVSVDKKDEETNYDRIITRGTVVAVFYRSAPAHVTEVGLA